MPRRSSSSNTRSTAASSAAAAAAVHSQQSGAVPVPTFTSFAAATAQVLAARNHPTTTTTTTSTASVSSTSASTSPSSLLTQADRTTSGSGSNSLPFGSSAVKKSTQTGNGGHQAAISPWDETALTLLRKCTKRDATTRTRALTDLSEHLILLGADPVTSGTFSTSTSGSNGSTQPLPTPPLQQLNNNNNNNSGKSNNSSSKSNSSTVVAADVGRAFVSAWPDTFSRLLADDVIAVRIATLAAMRDAVLHLGRRVQPALPHVLPSWIAAICDPASTQVAAAAKDSLVLAFPSLDKRRRMASLFAPRLCAHAVGLLQKIGRASRMNNNNNNNSRGSKANNKSKQNSNAKGKGTATESELTSLNGGVATKPVNREELVRYAAQVVAIVHWMLDTSRDFNLVSSVIDQPVVIDDKKDANNKSNNQFHIFTLIASALRTNQSKKDVVVSHSSASSLTTRSAADLVIAILRLIKESPVVDALNEQRVKHIVDFATALARSANPYPHPATWDVFLVLLSDFPVFVQSALPSLATALSAAAIATDAAALAALLPIVAALQDRGFAMSLLTPLCRRLFPFAATVDTSSATTTTTSSKSSSNSVSQPSQKRSSAPSLAFILVAFPPFIQTVTYVIASLVRDDVSESNSALASQWLNQFALPVCQAFVAGSVPPVSQAPASSRVTFVKPSSVAAASEARTESRASQSGVGHAEKESSSDTLSSIATLVKLITSRFKPAQENVVNVGDVASNGEDSPLKAIAQSLCQGLLVNMKRETQQRQLVARFEDLLDAIGDCSTEQALGQAVIQHVAQLIGDQISTATEQTEQSNTEHDKQHGQAPQPSEAALMLRLLSSLFNKRAGSLLILEAVESSTVTISTDVITALLSLAHASIASLRLAAFDDGDEKSLAAHDQVAANVGTLFSWLVWVRDRAEQHKPKVDEALEQLRQGATSTCANPVSLNVAAHLLHAHEQRQASPDFALCPALQHVFIDAVVNDAADSAKTTKYARKSCFALLVAAVRLANLSETAVQRIVTYVSGIKDSDDSDVSEDVNALIVALLDSRHVESLASSRGQTLASVAFTRTVVAPQMQSSGVVNALIGRLAALKESDEAVTVVKMLIDNNVKGVDVVHDHDAAAEEEDEDEDGESLSTRRGETLAKLITHLGERDVEASVQVCSHLFDNSSKISPSCTIGVLNATAFTFVFGGRDGVNMDVARLLDLSNQKQYRSAVLTQLPKYLESLCNVDADGNSDDDYDDEDIDEDDDEIGQVRTDPIRDIALAATDSYLDDYEGRPSRLVIVGLICSLRPLRRRCLAAIAGRIERIVDCVRQPRHQPSLSSSSSSSATVAAASPAATTLKAVAQLVGVCIHRSDAAILSFLQQTVSDLVTIIRRDPTSIAARHAIDVFCVVAAGATSAGADSLSIADRTWLFDQSMVVVMRAIRRCLEMPRGLSKATVLSVEAYGAAVAVLGIGAPYVQQAATVERDDARFWRIRVADALKRFVSRASAALGDHDDIGYDEASSVDVCKRIAWMCRLGDKLVGETSELDDVGISNSNNNNKKASVSNATSSASAAAAAAVPDEDSCAAAVQAMNDDVCHWGAWSTMFVLPHLQKHSIEPESANTFPIEGFAMDVNGGDSAVTSVAGVDDDMRFDSVQADGCLSLVLTAAERDVLLDQDGGFRVSSRRILVYNILPWLRSVGPALVRKAVLTLVAHAAAVDLPQWIDTHFPHPNSNSNSNGNASQVTGGFPDETAENKFATDVFPQPLRTALAWTPLCERIPVHEVGFFLAWRLLLDLINTDSDSNSGNDNGDGDGEDVSLRRMAVTFFRTEEGSQLFRQFIKRCVNVVVDGSDVERRAAAQAAQTALQLDTQSQRPAQGIQLVAAQQKQLQQKQQQPESLNTNTSVTSTVSSGDNELDSDAPEHQERHKQEEYQHQLQVEVGQVAGIAFARVLQRMPALSRETLTGGRSIERGAVTRVEKFVRDRISPLLIAAEVRRVREWGSFGGGGGGSSGSSGAGSSSSSSAPPLGGDDGQVEARGSVAGRECWASYRFSDVTMEIAVRLPEAFPLRTAVVEARSRVGMSEARWRKTVLAMTLLLQVRDGCVAEAVDLWRRNLDQTFKGKEECPICYSVLHMSTAALPTMQCRTCKKLFHGDCLCKWFTKSNTSACPLCRSAF